MTQERYANPLRIRIPAGSETPERSSSASRPAKRIGVSAKAVRRRRQPAATFPAAAGAKRGGGVTSDPGCDGSSIICDGFSIIEAYPGFWGNELARAETMILLIRCRSVHI
jgi:hypothetical protein